MNGAMAGAQWNPGLAVPAAQNAMGAVRWKAYNGFVLRKMINLTWRWP
jgi:hypothetical protein